MNIKRGPVRIAKKLAKELIHLQRRADRSTFLSYSAALLVKMPWVITSRSLNPVYDALKMRRCTFTVFGTKVTRNGFTSLVREIYSDQAYFAIKGFKIIPGDVVVDMGAGRGDFTLLAACLGAQVVAVEARSVRIPQINALLQEHGCDGKVTLVAGIIGGSAGQFSDVTALPEAFRSGLARPLHMGELMERYKLDRIDFLKMDIEGSEFGVIAADADLRWLQRVKRIVMEVHPAYGSPAAMRGLLHAAGFRTHLLNPDLDQVTELRDEAGYIFAEKLLAPAPVEAGGRA